MPQSRETKLQIGYIALGTGGFYHTTSISKYLLEILLCAGSIYHTCCNSFPYEHHDTRHTDIRLKVYPAM